MLIKDIPFKAVKEMALEEQFNCVNIKDEDRTLICSFHWRNTKLGADFWFYIEVEYFEEARKIWDWDKEVQNDR